MLWQLGEKLHRREGKGLSKLIDGTQCFYEVAFIIFATFAVLDKNIKVIANESVNGWGDKQHYLVIRVKRAIL